MILRPVKSGGDSLSQPPAEELASALNLLRSIIGAPEQQQLLNPNERPVNSMVYTHGVTLWMLILQRLGGGKTLNEVVSQIISHDRDLLPDNKRVRESLDDRCGSCVVSPRISNLQRSNYVPL